MEFEGVSTTNGPKTFLHPTIVVIDFVLGDASQPTSKATPMCDPLKAIQRSMNGNQDLLDQVVNCGLLNLRPLTPPPN